MKILHTTTLALVCLGLTACSSGSVQETLGLERSAPDEFKVLSRPPLSVPPEFNLRPPGDTAGAAPSVQSAHEKAENLIRQDGEGNVYALPSGKADTAVMPVQLSTPSQPESAEAQLLKNAGADKADTGVREELIEEKIDRQIKSEEKDWWDSMWSWSEEGEAEPVIDAKGETQRIQTNEEQGKPVNQGDIPEYRKDRSTWDRIFGE